MNVSILNTTVEQSSHTSWCYGLSKHWCFAALALAELLPALIFIGFVGSFRLYNLVYRYPLVKPASSIRYNLKLFLSLLAIVFVAFMGLETDGIYGYASTIVPLCLTLLAWILSLFILVMGHHRAVPQKFYGLRLWWAMEFVSNSVIFAMHSGLHAPDLVHTIRGLYLCCCVALAGLSFYPKDQEAYEPLVLSNEASGQRQVATTGTNSNSVFQATSSSPLLHSTEERSGDNGTFVSSNASAVRDAAARKKLTKKLSSKLMMAGASSSVYRQVFEEWNNALNENALNEGDEDQVEQDDEEEVT